MCNESSSSRGEQAKTSKMDYHNTQGKDMRNEETALFRPVEQSNLASATPANNFQEFDNKLVGVGHPINIYDEKDQMIYDAVKGGAGTLGEIKESNESITNKDISRALDRNVVALQYGAMARGGR